MNDALGSKLGRELDAVARRYADRTRDRVLALGGTLVAVAGIVAIVFAVRRGVAVPPWVYLVLLAVAAGFVAVAFGRTRRGRDRLSVARRLEGRFPDLNTRLLTALEQKPEQADGALGYLQETVVVDTLAHARGGRWAAVVPAGSLVAARWASRAALAAAAVVLIVMLGVGPRRGGTLATGPDTPGAITVEPGNTSLERNTGLLVLARFAGALPGEVALLSKDAGGAVDTLTMTKSLDDPVFAVRVPALKTDLQYAVRHNGEQTRWFTASVFDYPELKQADADLKYPAYTQLPDKHAEDVRSVTAVEGTTAKLVLRLNKPVTEAVLLPAAAPAKPGQTPAAAVPIALTPDPQHPEIVTATLDLRQSQTLRLQLTDAAGRRNKQPAAELAINVNVNRPPELKPVTPGRDVDASPIQELGTGVRAWDDFGVRRVGISYGMAGQPMTETTLAADVPGGQRRDVSQLLSLEQLKAQPDQLLSYFFWAEDFAADGSVRRTSGDMYFAEVRPFEEIFRQGEQPSEGEQQQQQQQQQQQGGNGQQAEQLAELQKQIIAATWKVMRRETTTPPGDAFAPDVSLVRQSQASAREQAAALEERLTDARSRGFIKTVLQHMDAAAAALDAALEAKSLPSLATALTSEQAAYQGLLRLRAREFEVTRGSRQQQQGAQSESSASNRRQQQLDQLQLEQEQNRYQTERSAAPQADNPQQRETRQVLNRLKELAQRQEDLNRQMAEIKSALEQAREDKQREELQRQLARLRDQQQQQLRDTDELRDRMDRPENQEQMAEARQQLEQTRENVRQASESLEQGRVPEAATSGARASEQLNNLRDEVRRNSAGQLAEAMTDLRQQARSLDEQQKQVSEQLQKLDAGAQKTLRETDDRKQLARQLGQQKQQLDTLLENMRKTVEAAESTEPLASKQLYDTLRQAGQQQTDQTLDVSRQLLDRGFTNEARQAEAEAGKGIAQLRQGVEQAATNVLGDEAEALRRARNELDRLADELEREVSRNRPARAAATTGPADRRLARAPRPSTRPVAGGDRGPTTRRTGQLALGGDAPRPGDRGEAATPPGTDPRNVGAQSAGQSRAGQPSRRGNTTRPAADATTAPAGQQSGEPNEQAGDTLAGGDPAQGQRAQRGQAGAEAGQSPQADASQRGAGRQPGQGRQGQGEPGQGQPGQGEQGQGEQGQGQQGQGEQAQGGQQAGPSGEGREPGQGQQGQSGQPGQGQQGQAQQGQGQGEGQQGGQGQQGQGQQGQGQQGEGQGQGQGGPRQQGEGRGQGRPGDGGQPDQPGQPEENQPGEPTEAGEGRPGQRGQGAARGRGLRGQQPGEPAPTDAGEQARDDDASPRPATPQVGPPGLGEANRRAGDDGQAGGGDMGNGDESGRVEPGAAAGGPLTGQGFRDWSDRLRDVEEMVGDPRLRDRAARIRERARDVRSELKRHSKQPNWDVVEETVAQPLADLRQQVAQELRRRESPDALVPLDREPVPPQYADQVRQYYERLGSGR